MKRKTAWVLTVAALVIAVMHISAVGRTPTPPLSPSASTAFPAASSSASSNLVPQEPSPISAMELAEPRMIDSIPPELFERMFQDNKLVGSPGLAWKRKRVITVAFNGGSDPLYQLIERAAKEWTALGGQLSLSFKDANGSYRLWTIQDKTPKADIRISFGDTGYWSLLGVLATNARPGDPTMNFDSFPSKLQKYFHGQNADTWGTSYERVAILHEFGHALGLSHEHFNPQCQMDLKKDSIIAYLMGPPNNWTRDQARFNIDAQYYAQILAKQAGPQESKLITSPNTDQKSMMLYVFSSAHYKSGDQSVCKPIGDAGKAWPTSISAGDKEFYLANYLVISSPFGPASAPAGNQK